MLQRRQFIYLFIFDFKKGNWQWYYYLLPIYISGCCYALNTLNLLKEEENGRAIIELKKNKKHKILW